MMGEIMGIEKIRKFLFVMDPAETLNLETETSLLLMQELLRRDHQVYWLQLEDLALTLNQLMGRVMAVMATEPLRRERPVWLNLNQFDAVLVRKDPPFDTQYLQLTLLLDHLEPGVIQFNDVKALRNFNEKLLPLLWPEFTPPTLISMNAEQLEDFAMEHKHMVLKPLNDCSGRGIAKVIWDKHGNFRQQIDRALLGADGKPSFVVAQKYLSAVSQGDKRVYLVNGRSVGVVNRIPKPGSFLANIHQGAMSEAAVLSSREKHIIRTIAPFLSKQGIFLAGADFIGGYLTELNITSPSAVRQINKVSGTQLERIIVDAMLERLSLRPCCEHWLGKAA